MDKKRVQISDEEHTLQNKEKNKRKCEEYVYNFLFRIFILVIAT